MPRERKITITKKNIPTIIEAVKTNGDLSKRAGTAIKVLEVMLYLAQDNVVNLKGSQLANLLKKSPSLISHKLSLLKKYDYIKDITPEGEVSSIWQINIAKLELIVNTFLELQKLSNKLSKKN